MKRLNGNWVAGVASVALAALAATPALAQQQQPGQAVPPPHGLTGSSTNASGGVGDALITAKAKSALLGVRDVHGGRIGVTTNQGVVTLSGTVPNAAERDRAERTVQNLNGVSRVNNGLSVGAGRR
jgi:osmotically-inducible protein OsmY